MDHASSLAFGGASKAIGEHNIGSQSNVNWRRLERVGAFFFGGEMTVPIFVLPIRIFI